MKKYYLAYGSNLNLRQMNLRCKNSIPIGTTILKDYRLVYKGVIDNYSYLTIEKSKGHHVPIGVYEINTLDELSLDKYEGFPKFYYKKDFSFNINDQEEKGLIYIMHECFDYCMPSQEYINTCIQGYEDFNFDKNLLDEAFNFSLNNRSKTFYKKKD